MTLVEKFIAVCDNPQGATKIASIGDRSNSSSSQTKFLPYNQLWRRRKERNQEAPKPLYEQLTPPHHIQPTPDKDDSETEVKTALLNMNNQFMRNMQQTPPNPAVQPIDMNSKMQVKDRMQAFGALRKKPGFLSPDIKFAENIGYVGNFLTKMASEPIVISGIGSGPAAQTQLNPALPMHDDDATFKIMGATGAPVLGPNNLRSTPAPSSLGGYSSGNTAKNMSPVRMSMHFGAPVDEYKREFINTLSNEYEGRDVYNELTPRESTGLFFNILKNLPEEYSPQVRTETNYAPERMFNVKQTLMDKALGQHRQQTEYQRDWDNVLAEAKKLKWLKDYGRDPNWVDHSQRLFFKSYLPMLATSAQSFEGPGALVTVPLTAGGIFAAGSAASRAIDKWRGVAPPDWGMSDIRGIGWDGLIDGAFPGISNAGKLAKGLRFIGNMGRFNEASDAAGNLAESLGADKNKRLLIEFAAGGLGQHTSETLGNKLVKLRTLLQEPTLAKTVLPSVLSEMSSKTVAQSAKEAITFLGINKAIESAMEKYKAHKALAAPTAAMMMTRAAPGAQSGGQGYEAEENTAAPTGSPIPPSNSSTSVNRSIVDNAKSVGPYALLALLLGGGGIYGVNRYFENRARKKKISQAVAGLRGM